ncbi:hypothetical protein [Candidatus Mycoplasma mahonii]|uniref:hypothetical protein n=1 Tax=Candidatus Mycoplasma mahonii TaxID=3004105 RepID=UPI0026ED4A27|nr:hypothetical protein [Candidatus Mycoplasma mahonii]WKX02387.1 hypothetical protein O3I44_03250 [Candidatus Mycoplasma mahonii]
MKNALVADENQKFAKEFSDEIASMNIVPARRVLYGARSGTSVTYFNCFVMPMPEDSREQGQEKYPSQALNAFKWP